MCRLSDDLLHRAIQVNKKHFFSYSTCFSSPNYPCDKFVSVECEDKYDFHFRDIRNNLFNVCESTWQNF